MYAYFRTKAIAEPSRGTRYQHAGSDAESAFSALTARRENGYARWPVGTMEHTRAGVHEAWGNV